MAISLITIVCIVDPPCSFSTGCNRVHCLPSAVLHCSEKQHKRGVGCEKADMRRVTTPPPPPVPEAGKVQLYLLSWRLGMQWYPNYWEIVMCIYMLLNGWRLIPDIVCCCCKAVSVVRQLKASGRGDPGPAHCLLLPCPGRKHFATWFPLCPGAMAHVVTRLWQPRTCPAHTSIVKAWHASVLICAV